MPIKPVDRWKLISEYLDAFRLANPDSKAPIIAWNSPFYYFKNRQDLPWEKKRYRHRDLQRMLNVLQERTGWRPVAAPDSQPLCQDPAPRKPLTAS